MPQGKEEGLLTLKTKLALWGWTFHGLGWLWTILMLLPAMQGSWLKFGCLAISILFFLAGLGCFVRLLTPKK